MPDLNKLLSGEGGEENLDKLMEEMMKSVMSKEFMHGPVKQICDEFPGYLKNPSLSREDRSRYERQFEAYKALLVEFERETVNQDKVAQIMKDLERFGNPPPEVMKMMNMDGGGAGAPPPCPVQ